MAEPLFLERIELSNFRVYGEDFSLTLPSGPGVTLISGPNGMGKTTFFDALEWGLTGEIRRFNDYLTKRSRAEHLTRFGASEASHRVSLYFNGGSPIDRTATYEVPESQVASLLKAPSWPEISDLYSYLSITHFLGQSSGQRFSLKKPSEQWQALRGPAGVDRLNWAKERIGSNATRMAFNRAIKEFAIELDLAQNELGEWRTLLSRQATAKRLTSMRSLSPDEVLKALGDVEGDLGLVTRTNAGISKPSSDVLGNLEAVREILVSTRDASASKLTELNSLEALPAEHTALQHELTSIATKVQSADNEEAANRRKISNENEALRRYEGMQSKLESEVSKLKLDQIALSSLREAHETVTSTDKALAEFEAQRLSLESSIAKFGQDRETLRSEEEQRAALLTRREELTVSLTEARRIFELFHRFEAARIDLDSFVELHKSDLTVDQLRLSLEVAEREDAELAQREIEKRNKIESLSTRDAAIDAAVSVIVSHLNTEDIECPVCKSRFEEGLLRVVQGQVRVQSSELSPLAEELNELRNSRESVVLRVTKIQRDLEARGFIDRTKRSKEAHLNDLVAELARFNVAVQMPDEVVKRLQARIDELESMLRATELSLVTSSDPREISSKIDAIDSSLTVAKSKLASIRLEMERTRTRREAASITISKHNRRLEDAGFEPSRWNEYLSSNVTDANQRSQELSDLIELIQPVKKRVEDLRQVSEVGERQRLAFIEDQKVAQFRLRDLEERWAGAGLSFPIDATSLLKAQQEEVAKKSSIDSLLVRLRNLLDGYKAWLEDRDINLVNEEISSKLKQAACSSEIEFDALLVGKVEIARRKVERSTAVREMSEQFVHSLQVKADAYSEQVLRPLNTCIRQFSRALMTRADDSVTYRAEHYANRSELKPEINLRKGIGGETSIEMNPNLYFSEGQLAALSISALFAASTCFRWSRWKALLLDDPLQHSDVIHASAFVDVIANLVKELGYQVIVSTHDEAEFEYMANKFRSASIPLSLCELRVKGSIGPKGSFVQSDSAESL